MSTYVAVFALVLAYVAVVAAYLALRTLAKLRAAGAVTRHASAARPAQVPQALVDATNRNAQVSDTLAAQLEALRAEVETSAETIAKLGERKDDTAGSLRNIALVRYDAFGEMSGRMSFSLALLNDKGDGVTITAIAGRSDTSVYAKGVTNGKGEHDLSPEEQQAVSTALHRPRPGLLGRKVS
jgi:hypothetical protein